MTLFAIICRDAANSAALREKLFADHLAHIEAHIDDYAVAGPLKEGGKTVGSMLVVKVENENEARAIFEADPYFDGGVWKSVEINQFLGVAGDWVGGVAWK